MVLSPQSQDTQYRNQGIQLEAMSLNILLHNLWLQTGLLWHSMTVFFTLKTEQLLLPKRDPQKTGTISTPP